MFDKLLGIIAPHYCYGCNNPGRLLCDNCKYNISSEPFSGCIVCQKPSGEQGVCSSCETSFSRAWCVSERADILERVLNGYKFDRQKTSAAVLAELLDERLPDFSHNDIVIVPIPTVASHIRQRGYDHTKVIAKQFAKIRKLTIDTSLLRRKTKTKQFGASKKQRITQAKVAYRVTKPIDKTKVYLIIDDIATTGSTLEYASKALKDKGAEHIWVAVIARQPLDK
jgi:competence protein ComFC